MSIIDNFASPGNPVVNITGTPLGVQVLFADKGSPARTVHPLAPYETALGLSASFLTLLLTPLSQFGDQVWSQNKDSSGQTMRDRVSALVSTGIVTQVNSQFPGHPPYNISVSLPETGILRAIVIGGDAEFPATNVYLSYELNGNSASWSLHNTEIWPLSDASYTLTFDLELLIQIVIPAEAGSPLTTTATANVENANISGANVLADIGDFAAGVINFINDQPFNIFQAAEGAIDSEGSGLVVGLGDLSALLADVSTAWLQALPYGFTQLTALIQQQQLFLQFGHPQDPAPVVVNAAAPTFPNLLPANITTAPEVNAGSSADVTGANFPLDQADALYIGWQDTTSGTVTESDISWGPAGGPTQAVTIPRDGNDGKNLYTASGLAPNSTYEFSVRDQDFLTETPFSAPFAATTTTTNLVEFSLVPVTGGTETPVGSTILTATGSFSAAINIPPSQPPGMYNLTAVLTGTQLAFTPLQVVAAGQPLPPSIEVDGVALPNTANLTEGNPFTVSFEGFLPGTVSVFVDSPTTGQLIGTATSSGPGAFTATLVWPDIEGAHSLYAQEIVSAQTLTSLPCPVFGSKPPP